MPRLTSTGTFVRIAARTCAVLAALLPVRPPGAAAQTTTTLGAIVVRPLSIGDHDVSLGTNYVNVEDCKSDAVIVFELDGVSTQSVDVYTGENCNQTTRVSTTEQHCTYIDNYEAGVTRGLRIEVKASDLIDNCDTAQDATPKIWFLAVKDPGSAEDVGSNYGLYSDLQIDTRAPSPPTDLKGGSGENQIPVDWKPVGTDLDGFVVLIDSAPTSGGGGGAGNGVDEDAGTDAATGGTASNGACGSNVLTPGGSASDLPSRVKQENISKGSSTGTNLSSSDIDGNQAAVAVVAVDLAGNRSPISELTCVDVVPTNGFWDNYASEDGAVDKGCPCTALGPVHAQSAWPVGLSLGFLALSARRRRRS